MFNFLRNRRAQVVTVVLLAQAVVYYTLAESEVIAQIAEWRTFPEELRDWTSGQDIPIDQNILERLRPDDYLNRTYMRATGDAALSLFVGYFNSRRNGRAPHSPAACLPGAGWKSQAAVVRKLPVDTHGRSITVNEYVVSKGGMSLLVLYWYHQGGRVFASEAAAQFYSLPALLLHRRTDTALVRIVTPVEAGATHKARTVASEFASQIYPLIQRHLDAPSGVRSHTSIGKPVSFDRRG